MTPEIEKKTVGRGAAYVYVETIASIISGYIFWIIMSKITTTETIGISSAVVSFAGIVAVVSSIGIPTGIQRFIGKNFLEKNFDQARSVVITSLILISTGILLCSAIILVTHGWIQVVFRIDYSLTVISILLVGSSVMSMMFRSVVISSLRTGSLPVIIISSSIFKLILSIALVLLGQGPIGLTLGLTFNHVLSSILLSIIVFTNILPISPKKKISINFISNAKKILVSSIVYWIPFLITTIGSYLGTIVVFGTEGSQEAGVYFLALTIVTGLISVMNSLFTIALPALSALKDRRKRFAWQTIRMSGIILLPFSYSLIFYSKEIMRLLGNDYIIGSSYLQILLLSIFPMIILSGVNALVYSYGNYRQVFLIGAAMSIPRTLLYFLLVPTYGGIGAAMSYTVGSIIGCVVATIISKKIGMIIYWRDIILLFLLPSTIGFILNYVGVNYVIAILASMMLSYLLLLKIHIITISDIRNILEVLPNKISTKIEKLITIFKN